MTLYNVYSIYDDGSMIEENLVYSTYDEYEAKRRAEIIEEYNKLEKHPEYHKVEIRFDEDFNLGTYLIYYSK